MITETKKNDRATLKRQYAELFKKECGALMDGKDVDNEENSTDKI